MRRGDDATCQFVALLYTHDVAWLQRRQVVRPTVVELLLLTLSVDELFTDLFGVSCNELRRNDWQLCSQFSAHEQFCRALV